MRSEGYPQVVKRAVIEVNLVPNFQAQSNPPNESFNTSAWIKGNMGARAAHAIDSVRESRPRKHSTGGFIEVDEAHFASDEYLGPDVPVYILGPNKPVRGRTPVVTNEVVTPLLKVLV
ncbi:MAG TPA: hypothetical protein VEI52_00505 [Terriglobales bacterium]|nr:hypothetical protein [Terriglobales bacterium]